MELQEIEITIDRNGAVGIHVRGVKGRACLDLTRPLEAALGGRVETRELTPEAHEPARVEKRTYRERREHGS